MTPRTVERRIIQLGGYKVKQSGSHRLYRAERELPGGTVVRARTYVPWHPGDIATGTLRAIEKQMEPVFGRRWL